jgi:hypothetical protein
MTYILTEKEQTKFALKYGKLIFNYFKKELKLNKKVKDWIWSDNSFDISDDIIIEIYFDKQHFLNIDTEVMYKISRFCYIPTNKYLLPQLVERDDNLVLLLSFNKNIVENPHFIVTFVK